MYNKILKIFTIAAILFFFSCSSDSKRYIGNQMLDSLTDTAINSAKSNASDSGSSRGSSKGLFGRGSGDAHFFEEDYFLVSKEPYKSGWISVRVARLVTPPSKETKNEGQFMFISDGSEIWTKYYWSSRIATAADIKIGQIVFASEAHANSDGVYFGPESKSETYDSWFMSKITDISDKHKGYVTVAGNYKVSIDALRIPVSGK
ncbi:MAG TPA: hypothetical protein PLA51_04470 [Spirochaetota bacterium]|jgi:hypothetical protein|nr:hypothetical protein [Spirochaetota bacterium]OQA94673.1 MAG: hypothetical protein BWY23_02707 [Spirochaetes bacterium ADurb.Bin218]HON15714.1 hypothetical protein [Spirochaetota bacterium]HOQ12438.1 hypothetical protein [Spirochaetota bacterium]HPD77984.1 hypothetical protein [Spirochaetota bacterium]